MGDAVGARMGDRGVARDLLELLGSQVAILEESQRQGFRRAAEEPAQEPLQGRALRLRAAHLRLVEERSSGTLAGHVALRLQDAEQRANRRVVRPVGE